MSSMKVAQADYGLGMGYGIQGYMVHYAVVQYLENKPGNCILPESLRQAPSPPWFWGMLHFDDGSYIDWFLPHISPTITAKDSRQWKNRDFTHYPLSMGGLFHDAGRKRSQNLVKLD